MAVRNVNKDGYLGLTSDETLLVLEAIKEAHERIHSGSDRTALDTLIGRFLREGTHLTQKEYEFLRKLSPSMEELDFIDIDEVPKEELPKLKQYGEKVATKRREALQDIFHDAEALLAMMNRPGVMNAKIGMKFARTPKTSSSPTPASHAAVLEEIDRIGREICDSLGTILDKKEEELIAIAEANNKRERALKEFIKEQADALAEIRRVVERLVEPDHVEAGTPEKDQPNARLGFLSDEARARVMARIKKKVPTAAEAPPNRTILCE